jgi:hypothetical protein
VASGEVRWAAATPARAAAVGGDRSGNVYALMDVWLPNADRPVTELWKLDAAGERGWSLALGPALWGSAEMAVLPGGDVVIGACSAPSCYQAPEAPNVTAAVVRVSSAGAVAWTAAVPGNGFWSMDADAAGRTLAVVAAPGGARVVILDDAGGTVLDQATDLRAPRAAFGSDSGDFVIGGQDASERPVFERRTSDGATRFRQTLETPGGAIDRIDFAPNGSIALGGWFKNRLTWGSTTYDLDYWSGFLLVGGGDGSAQWSQADLDLDADAAGPARVAFGLENDVIAKTTTFGKLQANLRSYTRDGALQWRHDFRGIYGTAVGPVAVSWNGDVIVGAGGVSDAPFQSLAFDDATFFVAVLAP